MGVGPSAQNNGIRSLILASRDLHLPLSYSYFHRHPTDKLTTGKLIPLAVRMDLSKLCQFINLTQSASKEPTVKLKRRTPGTVVVIYEDSEHRARHAMKTLEKQTEPILRVCGGGDKEQYKTDV